MNTLSQTQRRRRTRSILAALTITLLSATIAGAAHAQNTLPYQNPRVPLDARVNDLFARLTPEERLSLSAGTGFATRAIPRLGVPPMEMVDAGQGVRGGSDGTQGPATLFPSGITMASSWDPDLLRRIGQAIGEEARNKGTGAQILLGPDVNIHRSPLGGRNGESFSEDPYLAAQLAVGYIRGMQSSGTSACIKHFAANNEEVDRDFVNVHVGERALREIYLPAFEAGVNQGHVWSVMSSYNQVNGFHSSANRYLLTDVLKHDWGFDGLVMSDWGGVHETVGTVNAGNDLEMPGAGFLGADSLRKALASGQIQQSSLDDSVRRILRTIIRVGLLDGKHIPDHSIVNSPAHRRLAYTAATEGIVLLKNQRNILPLDRRRIRSIAVIGPRAVEWQMGAGGSPELRPFSWVSPLDGIRKEAGNAVTVRYVKGASIDGEVGDPIPASVLSPSSGGATGLNAQYFANDNLQGNPVVSHVDQAVDFNWGGPGPLPGGGRNHFSIRWTGTITAPLSGNYKFTIVADDGCRLFIDDKTIIDHWVPSNGPPQSGSIDLIAGHKYAIRVEYFQAEGDAFIHLNWTAPGAKPFDEAIDAARHSDVAIVVLGSQYEGEGHDRPSLALPGSQDDLVRAVAAANKNTIVVLNNGTPCLMNGWLSQVPGLVEAWFPGEEGGSALASVLFGDVNPSGRLTDTFGARREDYPDFGHFPGVNGQVSYPEGIYVGYRHFDKQKLPVVFPFGYGLSYTSFRYSGLSLSSGTLTPGGKVAVHAMVTNTGSRAGTEIVQLYIHDPSAHIDRPIRELKGFARVSLNPGQTKPVTLTLDARSLAYYDVNGKQWKADAGRYDVEVGASSRDIRLRQPLTLNGTFTQTYRGR